MEFSIQMQALGSEVDTLLREMCGFLPDGREDMRDYAPIIIRDYPDIVNQGVAIVGKGITITPFEAWDRSKPKEQSFNWWRSYNDVKHSRVVNYKNASLKSCLYSLAGLFTLERYWLRKITTSSQIDDTPSRDSGVFRLQNWKLRFVPAVLKFMD